jgi:hypothetical protein
LLSGEAMKIQEEASLAERRSNKDARRLVSANDEG